MKKNILSILLVMALVFTMTACVANPDAQSTTTEATIVATVEPTTVVITAPAKIEPDLKVLPLSQEDIPSMTPEEVSAWFDEMVQFSKTETLSYQDMDNIGSNFDEIWWHNNNAIDQAEYEAKAYETFMNIYNQAIEQQIPLEKIKSWTWVPAAEVLYQYFTSDKFSSTESIVCDVLAELSEEDAIRVTKAFFENPLFDTNCNLPFEAIYQEHYEEVTTMGVERIMTLSKSANPKVLEQIDESFFISVCYCDYAVDLSEFTRNILENSSYDFVYKYEFFCNGGFGSDIADMAYKHLSELAQNADEETAELIRQVAAELYNEENANKLLDALEK